MATSSALCVSCAYNGKSECFSGRGFFPQVSPQGDGAGVIEFALSHLREFALRKPLDRARQAEAQRSFVKFARARGVAAFAHDSREAQHFDRMMRAAWAALSIPISAVEQAQNFSG